MSDESFDAIVIGAGPAGLMAAAELAEAGHRVMVADAMTSVARKFLMAGKSGLNLTRDEPAEQMLQAYGDSSRWLAPMIRAFDADDVQDWARDLGIDLFAGSTGRVFPVAMKASPLLRAWLGELQDLGVELRTRWKWIGWRGEQLVFDTPDGRVVVTSKATVLALGGASWARLGSDGSWAAHLRERGVCLSPFAPSNSAVCMSWSDHMRPYFGSALKSVRWCAGKTESRGEAVISQRGLEGGGVYTLSPALRRGEPLFADLLPDLSHEVLSSRLAGKKKTLRLAHWIRNSLRLSPAKTALFFEMTKGSALDRSDWVATLKSLPIKHAGLRPLDEAISTAGGIMQSELDDHLMLKSLPGVFCAGEMLDWEAPTGGYLLNACFATGRWAGQGAARYLANL